MKRALIAIAMFLDATLAYKYQPLPEEARFTGDKVGLAASLNQRAANYLKTGIVPYVFDKFHEFNVDPKSFSASILTIDLDNIKFEIPTPKQEFINNWDGTLKHDTNSYALATSNQNIKLTTDFKGKLGSFQIASGHLVADIEDLSFLIDLGFATQEADMYPGTGMGVGEE